TALDDLRDGLLGLALVLGGVLGDAALLGDDLLGGLVAREVGRGERSDVHRDVACDLGSGLVGGDQHADLRGRSLLVRCWYSLTTSPETRPIRRTRIFSPMVAPALVSASPKGVAARSSGSTAPDSTAAATAS